MQNSFKPAEINLLTRVIEQACAKLGGCDDSTKEWIAARVLARASEGEWTFDALLSVALYGSSTGVENGTSHETI